MCPPTANNIGDTLLFNAVIASSNTDETPANNIGNIKQPCSRVLLTRMTNNAWKETK